MTIEIKLPDVGLEEVEVTEIWVKAGDQVVSGQTLITVEGSKTAVDVPSPVAGTIQSVAVSCGDKMVAGNLIARCGEVSSSEISDEKGDVDGPVSETVDLPGGDSVHASPVVRKLARRLAIDLRKVEGTGRRGRILREDLRRYAERSSACPGSELPAGEQGGERLFPPVGSSAPTSRYPGEVEEKALSKIQKISGSNLLRSWITVPHVTQFDEVDITELEHFREEQNRKNEGRTRLTVLAFMVRVVAHALGRFPRLNSTLSPEGDTLILKKYVNIGVAMNTDRGLVVPVIRDVCRKGILELSAQLGELSEKARGGRLVPSDLQGGCFTVSNLGGVGGTAFTPIVNTPEVAILGMSRAAKRAVWMETGFVPRLLLPLSLSYDHRVIDGVEGVRFLNLVKEIISDIRLLSM